MALVGFRGCRGCLLCSTRWMLRLLLLRGGQPSDVLRQPCWPSAPGLLLLLPVLLQRLFKDVSAAGDTNPIAQQARRYW